MERVCQEKDTFVLTKKQQILCITKETFVHLTKRYQQSINTSPNEHILRYKEIFGNDQI